MPRFAANLSLMYAELPFMQRFAAAAADGFEAVEYLFPYDWPARELAAQLRAHGLRQVLLNAPAGGSADADIRAAWARGLRGTASLPGREAEFRHGVQLALRYADALDCPRIHLMAGVPGPGHAPQACERTYRRNLQWAARQAQAAGREALIEPINPRDMPGYFLQRQAQAHDTVLAVGEPALKVQMDLYHCQITEGDVSARLRQYLPTGRVAHLQVAGVPERHEPDVGELNGPYLFGVIDAISAECGWQGWVGCEYRPRAGTSQGLGWLRRWQQRPVA